MFYFVFRWLRFMQTRSRWTGLLQNPGNVGHCLERGRGEVSVHKDLLLAVGEGAKVEAS